MTPKSNDATALVEILDRLRFKKPFGLICENGFILSICLAEKYGALGYKLRSGDPPYMQAVAPGSRLMLNEANPYAAAVKADNDSGTKPPEFVVGGTATPVPTRYILPYEMVKEIAAYFLETGQPSRIPFGKRFRSQDGPRLTLTDSIERPD
jgi:hypothetical protein